MIDGLCGWGMNRFPVNWDLPKLTELLEHMDRRSLEVNIYNIPDLESFLQAVLLLPRSITSDFNFSAVALLRSGAGEDAYRYEYEPRS